jgi:peroxiredoxin
VATRHIPNFRAPASTGQTLSWESFQGKVPVLLAFMPEGIDHELMARFDELHSRFGDHRVQIMMVAPVTAKEARDEAESLGVTVPILSDPNREVLDQAGGSASAALYDMDGGEVRSYDFGDSAVTPDTILQDVSSMVIEGNLENMGGRS